MTTSNHRPFTYPDGRIDIPPHKSREGAVKYTDYAIGRFIQQCRNKEWFDRTVFVITADHCASSAGKTTLPVNKYHIPLLIYAPKYWEPKTITSLMSQIDIGPTLLGLLNFNYESKFLGYDIFEIDKDQERAFISTYQNLGYLKGNKMIILSPQGKVEEVIPDLSNGTAQPVPPEEPLVKEAIAWYESSAYLFKEGQLKYNP